MASVPVSSSAPFSNPALRFHALSQVLARTRAYWQPSPFCEPRPQWCAQHPLLTQKLLRLGDNTVRACEDDPQALQDLLRDDLPFVDELQQLTQLPEAGGGSDDFPERWSVDVPGRKWQQIAAFARALNWRQGPVLDWCAGKSHLGRTLARSRNVPLRAFERNAELCRDGESMAQKLGVAARFQCVDVLHDPLMLRMEEQVVALHACGDLHRQLLRQVVAQSVRRVALSPCCYHLWVSDRYQPLSKAGQAQDLQLDVRSLHLAMEEAVTASPRTQLQHVRLQIWRLGFDCLQRKLRGCDEYFSTPSLPMSAAQSSFETVCRQFAAHKNLPLPAQVNWDWFEKRGLQRWREVQRLQLLRHLFRRALELWLVGDLAMYLEEQGYRADLSVFCARDLTPRNLLLQAERVA